MAGQRWGIPAEPNLAPGLSPGKPHQWNERSNVTTNIWLNHPWGHLAGARGTSWLPEQLALCPWCLWLACWLSFAFHLLPSLITAKEHPPKATCCDPAPATQSQQQHQTAQIFPVGSWAQEANEARSGLVQPPSHQPGNTVLVSWMSKKNPKQTTLKKVFVCASDGLRGFFWPKVRDSSSKHPAFLTNPKE